MGAFAEYACAREDTLVLKPANSSFEEAAAAPVAALTALQGLRDKGKIQPGQQVLIQGATGGVGTFAVQIAKAFGAEVTAVCRTRNVDMVRSIGADHVIDYTQADFTKNGETYDVIFDVVGKSSFSRSIQSLTHNGRYLLGNPRLLQRVRGQCRHQGGTEQRVKCYHETGGIFPTILNAIVSQSSIARPLTHRSIRKIPPHC